MEEAHVTITVKPIHIERIAYWIVILGLAILLALAFMKDETCTPGSETAQDDADNANAAAPGTPTPTAPTAAAASCVDGIRNQAETDIDCGGTCGKCVTGKTCIAGTDCASTFCTAGVCAASAPTTLSGKVALDVIKANIIKSPSGTAKVTGIEYKVTNGVDTELDGYVIKIFVKNKAGTRCLNQEIQGTCDQPYAEFSSSRAIASGKDSGVQTQSFADLVSPHMGWYLIEDNGYEPSDASLDDIQVIAYLYDSAGNSIEGKIITDLVAVSP